MRLFFLRVKPANFRGLSNTRNLERNWQTRLPSQIASCCHTKLYWNASSVEQKRTFTNCCRSVPLVNEKLIGNATHRFCSSQTYDKSTGDRDPFSYVKQEIADMLESIREELKTPIGNLEGCSNYYFDGKGKYIRPTTIFLAGRLCNMHTHKESALSYSQRRIAMISEMIHTASLLHDDVIDEATTRRGKPAVNTVFTHKQTILAGDYVLSKASIALARLGNCKAVELIAEIIEDLVKGEIMQLFIDDDPQKRFDDYLDKTYRKTASLLANSCKAAAVLGEASEEVQEILFKFGKNIGIAFQLVDDTLDFTSTPTELGKQVAADLSLGLATAPVLFAAEIFPELEDLIMRRFCEEGDVQKAFHFVNKSNGIERTMNLALEYIKEAIDSIKLLEPSSDRDCLIDLANFVIKRKK
eukprot:Seg1725.4 transcript_id=Seg1725.4/GoldUCD/mRNA.D3Y31 product="Decaprenyl-diphosphate synthase subunit 1" protein_id=Seg1725.4/GoldUCD/D3Y31